MFQKTKVLYVIDSFQNPHAGTEGQLFQLIAAIGKEGFEPHLLVFRDSEYLRANAFPCSVTVLGHTSLTSPSTWLALWREARRFRRAGYSLAHVFFNDASVICPPVFQLSGIRTIISRRDMGYWYTPFYRWALRLTGRCVDAVVVNSHAVGAVTIDAERISQDKVKVIYNGYINESGQNLVQTDAPPTDLGGDTTVLCLVANLRPIKRIQDAIHAVSRICQRFPSAHLVIIGGGDPGELKALAKRLAVTDRIHFAGSRTDVQYCLSFADIGLLCSESEGYSNAIVEYMNAGLPVVASAVGGNSEAVIHGDTGLLYPMGSVEALVECLTELLVNPAKVQEMGKAGKALAESRHLLGNTVQAHTQLYRGLLGAGTLAQVQERTS